MTRAKSVYAFAKKPATAAKKSSTASERGKATQALLEMQIRAVGLSAWFVQEYKFHNERKWRFDFASIEDMVAVEIDGGNRMAKIINGRPVAVGRHTQEADMCKLNEAAILGWRILRFTPAQVKSGEAISAIERILK
jgi:very-short-patch-repair endonuclease